MQISVITPVYNAESFIVRSVESALAQPETAEIILVEDNSPDKSLDICKMLAAKYDKVHLFRHPNGENRGAGASRTLGMQKSTCDFIAFVDADNFYLPERFSRTKEVFASDPNCDGVYETIGNHVEDDVSLQRWHKAKKSVVPLVGITKPIEPEALTEALISGQYGWLTLDGLVLKRKVLIKMGAYMLENLKVHQDTEFIIRATTVARLLPGKLNEPVAMRGIHNHNRISAPRSEHQKYEERMAFWMATFRWCKRRSPTVVKQEIVNKMILDTISLRNQDDLQDSTISRVSQRVKQLLTWFQNYPEVLFESALWHSMFRLIASKGREI